MRREGCILGIFGESEPTSSDSLNNMNGVEVIRDGGDRAAKSRIPTW